jgi:hypothetical protein
MTLSGFSNSYTSGPVPTFADLPGGTPNLSALPDTDTDELLAQVRRYVLLVDEARQGGLDAVLWSAAGRLANAAAQLDQALSHSGHLPRDWNSAHPARFPG